VDEFLRISGGILNVADTYPDHWGTDGGDFAGDIGFKYGWNTVPFGLAGRQYFVRAEFTF
jgi:iron complex outermembrane receptor protein